MLWGWIRQEMGDVKETLHKARLTALHAICVQALFSVSLRNTHQERILL